MVKSGKNSQTGGGGGVPDLGRFPTFSRFFFADVPKAEVLSGKGKLSKQIWVPSHSGATLHFITVNYSTMLCKSHTTLKTIRRSLWLCPKENFFIGDIPSVTRNIMGSVMRYLMWPVMISQSISQGSSSGWSLCWSYEKVFGIAQ